MCMISEYRNFFPSKEVEPSYPDTYIYVFSVSYPGISHFPENQQNVPHRAVAIHLGSLKTFVLHCGPGKV